MTNPQRWSASDAAAITGPQEVHLRTQRRDGSLRSPRIIWIVGDGDRVFIRSTNGRGADWFRWAIATGTGRLEARGAEFDVRFEELTDEAALRRVDEGYRAKYSSYASIVDHLVGAGPREATLELLPA